MWRKSGQNSCKVLILLEQVTESIHTRPTEFDLDQDQAGAKPCGADSRGVILPRRMLDGDPQAWTS